MVRRRLLLLAGNILGVWGQSPQRVCAIGVEVHPAHIEGLAPEPMGDVVHHPLDPHHPLGPAKAAKRGGGLRVRLQPVAHDPDVFEVIGVVGMEHRPVGHGDRKVLGPAAAGVLRELDPEDPAIRIHARAVVDPEVVALAGDREIVVAVVAHLGGPSRARRHQGAGDGERVALALLAAKAAAHPPHLDPNRVHRHPECVGHLVLDLGRVLRGGMDDHVTALLRQRKCRLPFEIEVLLPADLDTSLHDPGRARDGRCRIALLENPRTLLEAALGRHRLLDGEDRCFRRIGDLRQPRRFPGRQMRGCRHEEKGLAA